MTGWTQVAMLFCDKCGSPISPTRFVKPCLNCGAQQSTYLYMRKWVLRGFAVWACVAVAMLIWLVIWGPISH
jgi:hypothetical protein